MAHNSVFFPFRSPIVRAASLFISGVALCTAFAAEETQTASAPTPQSQVTRQVDGVSLDDYHTIQQILLEVAASDKDIAIIDAQLNALRAQRVELNFSAAAREHPELTDKLKIVLENVRARQMQQNAVAREATKLLRKKGP